MVVMAELYPPVRSAMAKPLHAVRGAGSLSWTPSNASNRFAVATRRVLEQAMGEHLDGSALHEKNWTSVQGPGRLCGV
jgi:hypothetical protein